MSLRGVLDQTDVHSLRLARVSGALRIRDLRPRTADEVHCCGHWRRSVHLETYIKVVVRVRHVVVFVALCLWHGGAEVRQAKNGGGREGRPGSVKHTKEVGPVRRNGPPSVEAHATVEEQLQAVRGAGEKVLTMVGERVRTDDGVPQHLPVSGERLILRSQKKQAILHLQRLASVPQPLSGHPRAVGGDEHDIPDDLHGDHRRAPASSITNDRNRVQLVLFASGTCVGNRTAGRALRPVGERPLEVLRLHRADIDRPVECHRGTVLRRGILQVLTKAPRADLLGSRGACLWGDGTIAVCHIRDGAPPRPRLV
eukprot:Hpha_TRINITY_DN15527_c3_g3::TRINITY_DN15527_c3_g3_i3::g.106101::m.106101